MASTRPKRKRKTRDGAVPSLEEASEARIDTPLPRQKCPKNLSWLGVPREEGGAQTLEELTEWHVKHAFGVSWPSCFHLCPNRYGKDKAGSDDRKARSCRCTDAHCEDNIFCLNHLGQAVWESENAFRKWSTTNKLPDPKSTLSSMRLENTPVGLRNLGATCYVNALLQVWFHNLPFRGAVYQSESCDQDSLLSHFRQIFAQMQLGSEGVCHPGALINRLGLDTREHQDAQEFSNLCLQHLKKAMKPLKESLLDNPVTALFEGTMAMGTECLSCHRKSRTESGFTELQLDLINGASVETLIENFLHTELLSGDNRYHCLTCDDLRDAQRYTEIVRLPPFLHLGLKRFAFDPKLLAKTKSHRKLKYPAWIDMRPFLTSGQDCAQAMVYDLVAVLSHKGKDSEWGHYVADVYDSTASRWYTFNDELVVANGKMDADTKQENNTISKYFIKETRSDAISSPPTVQESRKPNGQTVDGNGTSPSMTTSEAYMLVYALRQNTSIEPVVVPESLQKVVQEANEIHRAEQERQQTFQADQYKIFDTERAFKRSLYENWGEPDESIPSSFVPTSWLEEWCTEGLTQDSLPVVRHAADAIARGEEPNFTHTPTELKTGTGTDYTWMRCPHGKMNLDCLTDVKVIKTSELESIKALGTECPWAIASTEVCRTCCERMMCSKIFSSQHHKHLQYCHAYTPEILNDATLAVSTDWLQHFLQPDTTMQSPFIRPDGGYYFQQLLCLHGLLKPQANTEIWTPLSAEQVLLFNKLYPGLSLPNVTDVCAICREQSDEVKPLASPFMQKKEFGHLLSSRNLDSKTAFRCLPTIVNKAPDQDYFLLSRRWFDAWSSWVKHSDEYPPPGPIDNTGLMCKHQKLVYDPFDTRLTDENPSAYIILKSTDWQALKRYNRVLNFQKAFDGGWMRWCLDDLELSFRMMTKSIRLTGNTDAMVCRSCHTERILTFTSMQAFVCLEKDNFDRNDSRPAIRFIDRVSINSKARPKPQQSRRSGKDDQEQFPFPIALQKDSSVKDIKVAIMNRLRISPLSQALYFQGKLLGENTQTVAELSLRHGDLLSVVNLDEDEKTKAGSASASHALSGGFAGTDLASTFNNGIDEESALALALQASMESA